MKQTIIAKTLLWVASAAALGAAISAIFMVADAPGDTKVVEAWRMVGLATFAALFAILARQPQGNRPLWCVVILSKLLLVAAGLVLLGQEGVSGAVDIVVFDGLLVVLLIVAFFLAHRVRK